ncbi:MAG TPA: DegV family protein [Acidimicrobiales bacterium]|jgi:DegV family protein with EDD domain|nr:DegV family protein [Acidimicrobiales bacterium]
MPGIRVVTDSACDLPEDLVARYRIPVVALSVRFGDEELTEIGPKDFWVRAHQSSQLPQTAAPAPGAFVEVFRQLAAEGASGIACINLSSKLSGTIEAARAAARQVDAEVPVEVIDSTAVSLGQGLLVLGAARQAEEGRSLAEVSASVTAAAARLREYAVLDTLENLRRGGRLGGAKALLGSMLSIKPVIEIRDGVVREESKQRTRSRSLHHLAAKVAAAAAAGEVVELGVMHGDAPDIDTFVDLVAPAVPIDRIIVSLVGAVIGTHAGAGFVGVAWVGRPQ